MRDMGYRPPLSRATADTEDDWRTTIGVIYSRWNRLTTEVFYYSHIVTGILQAADDQGDHVTLYSHHTWTEDISRSLRRYCDGRCDGLILIAPRTDSELLVTLRQRGMPFVVAGDSGAGTDDSCVDMDNETAAFQLTDYLLRLGHTRIAYLPGKSYVRATAEREAGWRAAHTMRGLPVFRDPPADGGWLAEYGYQQTALLLDSDTPPTAILAINDTVAIGVMAVLRDRGIRIGEQVSVAGFDDTPEAAREAPPLTSVAQPYSEIGSRAVALLTALLDGKPTERILLPGVLKIRNSCGIPLP